MPRRTVPFLSTGEPVVILGAGRSGIAAARLARFLNHPALLVDEGNDFPEAARLDLSRRGVRFELGNAIKPEWVATQKKVIVSPGIPARKWAGEDAPVFRENVIGELEWAASMTDIPMAVVGGTNGKSTTSALMGHLLSAAGEEAFLGGNFGTPLSEMVLDVREGKKRFKALVVELSSFQAESLGNLDPWVNLLLNITPDHLDRYPTFESYKSAKWKAFETQSRESWAILNGDPKFGVLPAPSHTSRNATFLVGEEVGEAESYGTRLILSEDGRRAIIRGSSEIFPEPWDTSGYRLSGYGNRQNLAAGLLGAILFLRRKGHNVTQMKKTLEAALSTFPGLPHRMELVGEWKGVRFFNDSKATNVDATRLALRGFHGEKPSVHLILGGRDKGAPYSPLREEIRLTVKSIVAIGEARGKIRDALVGMVPFRMAGSLEDAVKTASEGTLPGEVVLLSPACSSYDMFHGFEERGDRFREIVKAWIQAEEDRKKGIGR
jgi:UDP-N-acetylmuramoylalanine--D-glutamate ligase